MTDLSELHFHIKKFTIGLQLYVSLPLLDKHGFVVVVVVVYFTLSRLLHLAFSANLGLL